MDVRERAQAAMHTFGKLSVEDQREMRRRQRESFIRAMTTPCEHGALDFEQCPLCRAA